MDGFTEKKWFVYLGDHHEGPFSLSEIQTKMNYGQLSATNYVWAEGMPDWTLMSDVQAFESILHSQPAAQPIRAAAPIAEPVLAVAEPALAVAEPVLAVAEPALAVALDAAPMALETAVAAVASGPILSAAHEPEHEPTQEDPRPSKSGGTKKGGSSMVRLGVFLLLVAGVGYAYNAGYLTPFLQSQTAQSVMEAAEPLLAKLGISPIPKLDDVPQEDYARLKAAAEASVDTGPQIAIAVSQSDLVSPTFYVASNLPDGTVLNIDLEGIPDTLLNELSFSAKTSVVITKRFGKTSPLQFSKGRGLPRGLYDLYVIDPGTQPAAAQPLLARIPPIQQPAGLDKGVRAIQTQQIFLGGLRDVMYTARLKEFHDKITAKAQQELAELSQAAMTLGSQLADTNQKFSTYSVRRGRRVPPSRKIAWKKFDANWSKLSQQLAQLFNSLTPESIQNDYFYGPLYQLGKQASDAINQLHAVQTSYFAEAGARNWDSKAFGIQLGANQASAKSAEDLLQASISQVQKLPPSPNGLPQKFQGLSSPTGEPHAAQ